ncbi:MAG: hypothetical protein KC501_30890, partial [Myxococcales bacterium]|nr:hypothetical protein [Myxococcales bacterium]
QAQASPKAEPASSRPEPPPPPRPSFVGDGWTRRPDDPTAPLLRLTELRPSRFDDPAPVRALLDLLEPLMACYEAELVGDPELVATLWIDRRGEADGLDLRVDARHPTRLVECLGPALRSAMPPVADDPHGRYAITLFPRRDAAPPLRQPELADEVIEREGGSCWTERTYPCAPHKACMAADWERTRCRHPADRPDVALRWAMGPAQDGRRPRIGLELVAADGSLVWRAPFEPDDVARLGSLPADEAQAHVEGARERPLPGAWWVELGPQRVGLADRAGVRFYDRRSGELRFRYVPPEPEADRTWLDEGTFVARRGKRRCKGDAGHGAFATRCGDELLYFDGHAFAVISTAWGASLRDQSTLSDPGSTRRGGAVRPSLGLRAGGYRLEVSGMVFMQ